MVPEHMEFGLLGEHLGHSFSPAIHRQLGSYDYQLVELSPEGAMTTSWWSSPRTRWAPFSRRGTSGG